MKHPSSFRFGHTPTKMWERYARPSKDALRTMAEVLNCRGAMEIAGVYGA